MVTPSSEIPSHVADGRFSRREILAAAAAPLFSFGGTKRIRVAGISFRRERHGRSAWRILHIHGDEATARDVASERVRAAKATGFFVESSTRAVSIGPLRIDPNRMFSREGATASLRRMNPNANEAQILNALLALDRERERFLDRILPPPGGVLIAMHNNSQGYSIRTEIPISKAVSFKDDKHAYDFMLLTSPADFAIAAQSPFNCVLQPSAPPPDDGSLSRVCGARGIRYVNIEAALGSAGPQAAMLDFVLANLPEMA